MQLTTQASLIPPIERIARIEGERLDWVLVLEKDVRCIHYVQDQKLTGQAVFQTLLGTDLLVRNGSGVLITVRHLYVRSGPDTS